jgi:hypothetical protein
MAEKRMFTQKIIDSDAFLDMPLSTQALYFHLNMRADDDGFINNPKRIQRTVGASEDDLKLLIAKRFVICFENGVIVIKHWRMHNTLRKDRYCPTQYQEQFAQLDVKDNNAYTERLPAAEIPLLESVATTWQPDGNQMATQYSIDKDSIDKISIDKKSKEAVSAETKPPRKKKKESYSDDSYLNDAILSFIEFRKGIKKPMTDRAVDLLINKLNGMTDSVQEQIAILNQSIMNGWTGVYELTEEKKGGKEESGDIYAGLL